MRCHRILPERDLRCIFPLSFALPSFGGDCLGATVTAGFAMLAALLLDMLYRGFWFSKEMRTQNEIKFPKKMQGPVGGV